MDDDKKKSLKRILAWLGIILALAFFVVFTITVFQSLTNPTVLPTDTNTSVGSTESRVNWREVGFLLVVGTGILYLIKKEDHKDN